MPRPSQAAERRRELLPLVARTFADLGYRRATTAELAARCKVQENILYRLWPDKKAMFIAAIDYVYELSEATWQGLLKRRGSSGSAQTLLTYESEHLGEFGHSRIIFAGLGETDDPEIRKALSAMYTRFQGFAKGQVSGRCPARPGKNRVDPALTAWALVGLGTIASIARELRLLSDRDRRRLMTEVGALLIGNDR